MKSLGVCQCARVSVKLRNRRMMCTKNYIVSSALSFYRIRTKFGRIVPLLILKNKVTLLRRIKLSRRMRSD